jgi:hypothetical protein
MLIENNTFDQPVGHDGSSVSQVVRGWLTVQLAGLGLGCIFFLAHISVVAVGEGDIIDPTPAPTPFTIPNRFLVNDSWILPPTDQSSLGTCWAFSAIYMLESAYRAQGVRDGFFPAEKYVSFSKQAYLKFLNDSCTTRPVKACQYGGLQNQNPSDHQIESLYYFSKAWPDLTQSILPEIVCPYTVNESEWFKCDNYSAAVRTNPLKWSIKSITTVYTIEAIKDLIVRTGRSLGFGVPLPALVYYVPCDGSPFSGSNECVSHTYPCPEYIGVPNASCYKARVGTRDQTGVFVASVDPKYMAEGGGHAMNLVGYNDNWLYRNRFQSAQVSSQHKGGFILHNSWRSGGHSVEYLYGSQSEENEAVICPNHVAPANWIPASFDCVRESAGNRTINNSLANCSADLERVRRHGRTRGADLLYCKSNDCNRSLLYVLERVGSDVNAKFTASGLAEVSLITIDNVTWEVGRTTVRNLSFHALSEYFEPITATFVPNDPDNCGYWIFPYDALENIVRINWDLLDNFRVVDLEIEFEGTSYELHPNATEGGADFSYLRRSTKLRNRPHFDGPLPFDLIYK